MAVEDFLNLFAAMPEAERLRALPGLGAGELDILQDAFEEDSLELSWPVQRLLFSRLYPDLPKPPSSSKVLLKRELIEIRRARYNGGAKPSYHIRHPDDAAERLAIPEHLIRIVYHDRNGSDLYDALDESGKWDKEKAQRREKELRAEAYAKRYGLEAASGAEESPAEEVETWRDELMADLAAMRALHGGKINGHGTASPG